MDNRSKLAAILLAAGPSSRLGQSKQLVKLNGESLVRRTARLLLASKPGDLVVVSGCEAERVSREVQDLPLRTVFNRSWEQGMGGSITCGVRALAGNTEGVLIMAVDQWRLEEKDLECLISAWNTDISRIYVTSWKEGKAFISGPPVIFPGSMIQELKVIDQKRGARQLIDRFMDNVEFVELENAAHDLDRKEDLELLNQA